MTLDPRSLELAAVWDAWCCGSSGEFGGDESAHIFICHFLRSLMMAPWLKFADSQVMNHEFLPN